MDFTIINGSILSQLTAKPIAISAIRFSVLRKIVKFTNREPQNYDPFDPYKLAEIALSEVNDNYYQRLTNDQRIKDIYHYLLKEINNVKNGKNVAIGTFPTSIILSLDLNEEYNDIETYRVFIEKTPPSSDGPYGAFLDINDNQVAFLIPLNKISLIVDGQHRMAGMFKLYHDALNNNIRIGRNRLSDEYPKLTNETIIEELEKFSFGCTLLLGFDLWEQGKVFADVNFNQKPVNKSLYYDIFGSLPNPDKNEIFLSHMLAMHLNNNLDSPLKGFIKMLGTGDGFFSQAFFVESLLNLFKPRNIWGDLPVDYVNGGTKHKILPILLKAYFNAIKIIFSDFWPQNGELSSKTYKHILAKTTGMGALMRLMQPIYQNLNKKNDLYNMTLTEIQTEIENILKKIKDKGKDYFSKDGNYSGAGSNGLQVNLFKNILSDLKATNALMD